jgi:hypothetical protein
MDANEEYLQRRKLLREHGSIGPTSANDREAYSRQKEGGWGFLKRVAQLPARSVNYINRAAVQVPKSFVQSAEELTLAAADPEGTWNNLSAAAAAEKASYNKLGDDYWEVLAQRAVDKVDATLKSPEAMGDAVASLIGGKFSALSKTKMDDLVIASKVVADLADKDYTEHPQPWSEILKFPERYKEAKQNARGEGRKLAPLWNWTDRADDYIARKFAPSNEVARALSPDPNIRMRG